MDFDLLIDKFLLISKNLEVGMNDELEVPLPFCTFFHRQRYRFSETVQELSVEAYLMYSPMSSRSECYHKQRLSSVERLMMDWKN